MRYHNITKDDMLNGDGLRVVLWVSGCRHHCPECQNPITWNPEDGLVFDEEAKKELYLELEKDYISGLTLSGGDPLYSSNQDTIRSLVQEVKSRYPQKTIWLYTGELWEDIYSDVMMRNIDVVVDGRFQIELKDTKLKWKGSANQRVIDVRSTLIQFDPSKPILYCND